MTTFDEREHAFEAKLAHDEELKFKARARRDKRLGLWAAGKLGKTGAAAEDYASRLVATAIAKDSAGQILKTIRADFDRAGDEWQNVAASGHGRECGNIEIARRRIHRPRRRNAGLRLRGNRSPVESR